MTEVNGSLRPQGASVPGCEGGQTAPDRQTFAWSGGKCQVPMWMAGCPAGHCGEPANGRQLPLEVLWNQRGWPNDQVPYSFGPCCPKHGGPRDGEPILFVDGLTEQGRQMWCAVMPDFENLQESPAGFDGDGNVAIANLNATIAALGSHAATSPHGYAASEGREVNQTTPLPAETKGRVKPQETGEA